ncbi:MAG: hypothetical protein METHAR1v1_810014 [Methanothrix sp.]|nr:MAG: hypothetical protein METHAR1v1_810014 [Methanothrix sp.]
MEGGQAGGSENWTIPLPEDPHFIKLRGDPDAGVSEDGSVVPLRRRGGYRGLEHPGVPPVR